MKPTGDTAFLVAMLAIVLAVLVFLGLLIAFVIADRRRRASWASYRKPSPMPEFRVTYRESTLPDDDLQELWIEDATTAGKPGHETIDMAWQRLFGEPEPLLPLETRMTEFRVYPGNRMAVRNDDRCRILAIVSKKKKGV